MSWLNPPPLKEKPVHPMGKLQKPKHGWIVIWVSVAFWVLLGQIGLLGIWLIRWLVTSAGFFPAQTVLWMAFVAFGSALVGVSIGTMLLMRLAYARSRK